ncbi:MAG: hypothetical protein ABI556_15120, partial [Gemmatimonadales bacterium]
MKFSAVSRLALVSAAALSIAACISTSDSPVSPKAAPAGPAFAGTPGVFAAGILSACISSPVAGNTYTFNTTVIGQKGGDALNSPANVTVPGPVCADVLTRSGAVDLDFATGTITASISPVVAGTWSWTCVSEDGSGLGCPDGLASVGNDNSAAGGENSNHGTTIT